MKTFKSKALVFFTATAFLLLSPHQLAFAHTGLVSSIPASGAVVETLPTEITLEFSENILVLAGKETSSIEVVAPNGDHLEAGQLAVSGRNLSIGLTSTEQSGEIRVTWRAVAQDGHPVEGKYFFSLVKKSSPTPTATPTPTPEVSNSATPNVGKNDSGSIIEIGLSGIVILIGLTFLVLRWRRNSGD
jgi:methionine-rich copper-binding protein CopC